MPKFDGTSARLDFEFYKTKLMAIGALKDGFQKAYKQDLPINVPGATLDPTLTANEKLRAIAMSYLILSTDGTPQDMIKPAGDDPHLAWKLLVCCDVWKKVDIYSLFLIGK